MTIVFLTRYFWPHVGGVERHVEAVGRELMKLGHKMTVITLKHEAKLPETQTYRGLKIVRLPYSNSKWEIWRALWQKRQILKSADIIHCHDVFFWYLPFRFLWPKKPVFTTFHGWEGVYPIPKRNIFAHHLAEKLSWGNICIGDYLPIHYGTRADFISYGAPLLPAPPRRLPVKELIFIGRLDRDLGLMEYFIAIKKLNLPVTFVGDGALRKEAAKIGKVVGVVKSLKPYLTRPAAILASSYLTMWEALSYGRPVFSLYQNQLKKDYLEKFPAAKAIHISGSAEELVEQFKSPKKIKIKFPDWKQVTRLYLKLWQKR